jgi:magnesium-transporting ATPase (P-type)
MVVSQDILDNLNVSQAAEENRKYLDSIGGPDALATMIGTDTQRGLTAAQVEIQRDRFGTNEFPQTPMTGFFTLWFEAFQDPTLLILIAAAVVSLVIGIIEEGTEHGWIEGAAILIAVVCVATVSAGNDYTKELQFRALESSSQADERTSVIRDGAVERINPIDIVIGDIVLLQVFFLSSS